MSVPTVRLKQRHNPRVADPQEPHVTTPPNDADPTREIPTAPVPVHPPTPTEPPVIAPTTTVTAPRGGTRRRWLIVVAAVLALAVGGGIYLAVDRLRAKGEQPEVAIPADAYVYVRIDLDPSAGQKIGVVRFLDKLPSESRDAFRELRDGKDPKKSVFDLIKRNSSCMSGQDYDRDVGTWLGDRAAVALRPGSSDVPNVLVTVAVNDETAARGYLDKLQHDCGNGKAVSDSADVSFRNGYAIFTAKGQGQGALDALDKGALATSETFRGDMAALGETGIWSMWVNGDAMVQQSWYRKAAQAQGPTANSEMDGRLAVAMRFDPSFVELAGITRGTKAAPDLPDAQPANVLRLPDNTAVAVHMAGLGAGLKANWSAFEAGLSAAEISAQDIEDMTGIWLPDDLETLFGRQTTVAVPNQSFRERVMRGGLRITSPDPAKAVGLLTEALQRNGASFAAIPHKVDGKDYFLSTTDEYLDELSKGGNLGGTDTFRLAVANPDQLAFAFFVDLDALESLYLNDVPADYRELVRSLRAVGMSVTPVVNGESRLSLRLVGN